ncbi:MAG TPA: phosphotransferase, partial [Acidimicrobiales bacterium]|nr:phosphotransferase [Acidimicrobiales bacterium]
MTSVGPWPQEAATDIATATEWVEQVVGAPARFSRLLREKLWGFTALFTTDEDAVVLKVASPPLFPAAHLAHAAAHRAAPHAVPELLAWSDRGDQHWSLFRNIDGLPARVVGADAVFAVVDIVSSIQVHLAHDLPIGLPSLPAGAVASLLTDLDDQPRELVAALDGEREQLSTWGHELDSLVPLSLDHVDLHLDNVLVAADQRFVVLDWEEAIASCPLFS